MNKCMAEIEDPVRIWTRDTRTKSQYHNHLAKENSLQRSCLVLYLIREAAMHEEVVSRNTAHLSFYMSVRLFVRKTFTSVTAFKCWKWYKMAFCQSFDLDLCTSGGENTVAIDLVALHVHSELNKVCLFYTMKINTLQCYKPNFYAPSSKDQGHIVLPSSVRLSVCLHSFNIFPLLLN